VIGSDRINNIRDPDFRDPESLALCRVIACLQIETTPASLIPKLELLWDFQE